MRQNSPESKEVKEEAASLSIYWMEEGANSEVNIGGGGGTLEAPHRLICGGTAGGPASAAAGVVLPRIWRGEEEVRREVRVDELKKLIYSGDEEIRKELLALLRRCGIPEEHAGEVERRLRELVRGEVRRRNLPEEEWLIDALYRILIYVAYVMRI
jgi:hypothetical protein